MTTSQFRGAINDEVGAYDGGIFMVDAKGVLAPSWDDVKDDEEEAIDWRSRKDAASTIEALWCAEDDYSWTFSTSIPHATFDVMEDGEHFCRGIIFDIKELPAPAVTA